MPPVRDKRYTAPGLYIDLFEMPLEVISWSSNGLIFWLGDHQFSVGQTLNGSLCFEQFEDTHGLVKAEITEISKSDGKAVASFTWLSRSAKDALDMAEALIKSGQDAPTPSMQLAVTWATRNWSLSGLLLEHDGRYFQGPRRVVGMIRAEKTDEPAVFTGGIIRHDQGAKTLAVKFVSMSDDTFGVLEKVMKKTRGLVNI